MSVRAGRPLRFLTMTLVGWTALRVAILWHDTGHLPGIAPILLPIARAVPADVADAPSEVATRAPLPLRPARASPPSVAGRAGHRGEPGAIALAMAGLFRFGPAHALLQAERQGPPMLVAPPGGSPRATAAPSAGRSRWSGDAWLLVRGGARSGPGFGAGQLGGSQAGVRIAYALDRQHRVALYGRADTPLKGHGREIAAGIEWRPAALPVRLVAEERVPLDGGKAAPAIGTIAGLDPTPVAAGFRLEAYGQAGVIDRDGVQGFADGAARLAHRLATIGAAHLDLGAGAWGGAQRGAARLDIGPTLGLAFRVGTLPARLTVDWRERVAGRARPGSGLAVSLGTDF